MFVLKGSREVREDTRSWLKGNLKAKATHGIVGKKVAGGWKQPDGRVNRRSVCLFVPQLECKHTAICQTYTHIHTNTHTRTQRPLTCWLQGQVIRSTISIQQFGTNHKNLHKREQLYRVNINQDWTGVKPECRLWGIGVLPVFCHGVLNT